jgi:hypothetical protein
MSEGGNSVARPFRSKLAHCEQISNDPGNNFRHQHPMDTTKVLIPSSINEAYLTSPIFCNNNIFFLTPNGSKYSLKKCHYYLKITFFLHFLFNILSVSELKKGSLPARAREMKATPLCKAEGKKNSFSYNKDAFKRFFLIL